MERWAFPGFRTELQDVRPVLKDSVPLIQNRNTIGDGPSPRGCGGARLTAGAGGDLADWVTAVLGAPCHHSCSSASPPASLPLLPQWLWGAGTQPSTGSRSGQELPQQCTDLRASVRGGRVLGTLVPWRHLQSPGLGASAGRRVSESRVPEWPVVPAMPAERASTPTMPSPPPRMQTARSGML